MDDQVVGVLGGGQLGRMLSEEASRLHVPLLFLDPSDSSPAKHISNPSIAHPKLAIAAASEPETKFKDGPSGHLTGSFASPEHVARLAQRIDVVTVEIEHVDTSVLFQIRDDAAKKDGKKVVVYPSPEVIKLVQDKYVQKEHLVSKGVPVAQYVGLDSVEPAQVKAICEKLGAPTMLKSRTLAYDGRGNAVVKHLDLGKNDDGSIEEAVKRLGGGERKLYAEKMVDFVAEVAVMVVRGRPDAEGAVKGESEVRCYPAVETIHRDSICHVVKMPLRKGGPGVAKRAEELAKQAVSALGEGAVGVFGVEMFLLKDGSLLINEIAPRPHNSGHYTIEACYASQYANHLRAILGLPLGSCEAKVPSSIMLNILGSADGQTGLDICHVLVRRALAVKGASVHWYGKGDCRKGRKMGHITVVGDCDADVEDALADLLSSPSTSSSITKTVAAAVSSSSSSSQPRDPALSPVQASAHHSSPHPLVSIIMGSVSDLPTMSAATNILRKFRVPFELTIVSAHRTPDRLVDFAKTARGRGVRCIIAGAGGAAHLPGMVASLTALPVVGVPVRGTELAGVDSVLSILQMPRGIPVATVAVNNSTNAALLAVRIIGGGGAISRLADETEEYAAELEKMVMDTVDKVDEEGWGKYVKE